MVVRYWFRGVIRLNHALAFFGECTIRVESLEVIVSGTSILYSKVPLAGYVDSYSIISLAQNGAFCTGNPEPSIVSCAIRSDREGV
jgi:hypothetical protein